MLFHFYVEYKTDEYSLHIKVIVQHLHIWLYKYVSFYTV